jgi:hypothetical protein
MSTLGLDSRKLKDLQPAVELWASYRPEQAAYRFRAAPGRHGLLRGPPWHQWPAGV